MGKQLHNVTLKIARPKPVISKISQLPLNKAFAGTSDISQIWYSESGSFKPVLLIWVKFFMTQKHTSHILKDTNFN